MTSINTGLDNKRVGFNIFFSCIAYVTNAFISLFITPYITSSLGAEAYGFVKLANDFSSYGSLMTLALNSMASRFIMLSRERGDKKEARAYYSSITVSNMILAIILLIPTIVLALCINKILNVPENLLNEVRWTFIWTLVNFLICLAGTTFGNCFFLENRLDISSILTSITSVLRAAFIIVAFAICGPKISIMAFGAIVVTSVFMPCNIIFHKKLTPELYFERKLVQWKKLWEVFTSGIWNSVTKLSQILTTGLDLTITNIFIGSLEMGYLSVAKTIPNFITALINSIGNSFTPNMMQLYAQKEEGKLKAAIKTSMKIMSIFSTIPNAILITMGTIFYTLWVPEQPTILINTLSIITVIGSCITGPVQPLYQVFTLTNKIRQSSIVFIISGLISIVTTIFCLQVLQIGVYAVAGVSVGLSIIVALCYHIPMAAIYLKLPWNTFYPEILKTVIILMVQCVMGKILNSLIFIEYSWMSFFIQACILGLLGLIISIIGLLKKNERIVLFNMIKKKIHFFK